MDDQGCSSSVPSLLEIFSISPRINFEMRWQDDDNTNWSLSGVQRLLDEGADVNEQGCNGFTTLHRATEARRWDTVQLLLDRGASIDVKTNEGRTALYYAVEAKHTEFVRQMLLKGADINVQDKYGDTVLHNAATGESEPLVELLLNSGADVNCKNNYGQTPLNRINSVRNSKIVAMLLESGATVNCKDNGGTTPLHSAAYNSNNHEIVEMLLESGAEVNSKDNNGQTPLHIATHYAQYNKDWSIKALLQAGALLDVKDVYGLTPVSYTTRENVKAIEYLLLKGARIEEKDKDSIPPTPLERCLINDYGHAELMLKLSSANLIKGHYKINLMDEDFKMKMGDRLYGIKNYEIVCVAEVNKMKAHKIGTLTLFSVFGDSPDPGFASRADEIQEVLDEAEKQNEYPIYISLLKSMLKEGVCRRALLDDACDILPRLIPTLNSLEVRRMVLAWLSNNDLENIIIAFYLTV